MSRYFTINELTRSDTAVRLGIANVPTQQERQRMEVLMNWLDGIRAKYGKPLYVNSGYRCQKLNRAVGGVWNSQHTKGEAVDLDTRCGQNKQLFDLINMYGGFDQLIWENGGKWIHVSHKATNNRGQVIR